MSSMNIQEQFQKMGLGEKIILIAGPLFLIDSFLKWYSIEVCFLDVCASASANGWEAPGAIWSILAVLIGVIMAGMVGAVRFANMKMPELPQGLSWGRLLLGMGGASALFVIIKLLNESSHLSYGFFLGIVLAGALVAGGFLTYQEEQNGSSSPASM